MSRESSQKVNSELFSLEPTALLEFFVIYYDYVNFRDEKLYIHGGTNGINGSIFWQGIEYVPFPIQSSGFESKGDGSLPRPKLAVSNQDFFVSNLIRRYNNLVGAKVVRKRTFVKFLDNNNFAENKNPYGSADSSAGLEDQVFFVLRRATENRAIVELELASPLEIDNVTFPRRTVMARYCSFHYRGNGCRYMGMPIADENDTVFHLTLQATAGLLRRYYTGLANTYPSNENELTTMIANGTFSSETVVSTTIIDEGENIGNEFLGYIKIPEGEGGNYEFGLDPDDSADLFINGQRIAYFYGSRGQAGSPSGTTTGSITLQAGYHRILMRHFEYTGGQGLTLYYKAPSSSLNPSWVAFPNSEFLYDFTDSLPSSSQRFYSDASLTKAVSINNDAALTKEFSRKWENNAQYKQGDCVYIENNNVKVSKRDVNSIPNWEPLQKFYFCIKTHTSSPAKHPAFNKEYWIGDQCSKTLNGCKLRFGSAAYLPFGGFPGTEEYSIST